jgi:hypothetical protein
MSRDNDIVLGEHYQWTHELIPYSVTLRREP